MTSRIEIGKSPTLIDQRLTTTRSPQSTTQTLVDRASRRTENPLHRITRPRSDKTWAAAVWCRVPAPLVNSLRRSVQLRHPRASNNDERGSADCRGHDADLNLPGGP